MHGITMELSDRIAEEYNDALVDDSRFVNRICSGRKISKSYIDLDQMFDGWTKEDFDFISGKSMRIALEAFGKHDFLVNMSPEQSAAINLYFGLLKIEEAETQNLKGLMNRIGHIHEIAEELIEEMDLKSREKEKLLKEKADLEKRLKEIDYIFKKQN